MFTPSWSQTACFCPMEEANVFARRNVLERMRACHVNGNICRMNCANRTDDILWRECIRDCDSIQNRCIQAINLELGL